MLSRRKLCEEYIWAIWTPYIFLAQTINKILNSKYKKIFLARFLIQFISRLISCAEFALQIITFALERSLEQLT